VKEEEAKMIDARNLSSWTPYALAALRIVAGLIFLEHGTQKLFGFPAGERAFVDALTLPWWAGVIELIFGTLITVGLFTRFAAFVASGEMAFAYWIAHAPQNLFPVNNGGDAAILYCFLFLFLVFAGPGKWSLDAWRGAEDLGTSHSVATGELRS
jgi:putative oxidoreductase